VKRSHRYRERRRESTPPVMLLASLRWYEQVVLACRHIPFYRGSLVTAVAVQFAALLKYCKFAQETPWDPPTPWDAPGGAVEVFKFERMERLDTKLCLSKP